MISEISRMQQLTRSAAILTLGLVATSCAVDIGPHLELTRQVHERAIQHITARDLENCASKVSEFKGVFGNSEYRLKGPLRPDKGLTCMHVSTLVKDPPSIAFYSAPAEHVSGYGGILVPEESKFLWCRFRVTDGAVTLEDWSIGLRANKALARRCGLKTA
jgi:hypothetical protein